MYKCTLRINKNKCTYFLKVTRLSGELLSVNKVVNFFELLVTLLIHRLLHLIMIIILFIMLMWRSPEYREIFDYQPYNR